MFPSGHLLDYSSCCSLWPLAEPLLTILSLCLEVITLFPCLFLCMSFSLSLSLCPSPSLTPLFSFSHLDSRCCTETSGGQSSLPPLRAKIFVVIPHLAPNVCANIAYEYKLPSAKIIKENVFWINFEVTFLYVGKGSVVLWVGSQHSGARLLRYGFLLCYFPAVGCWVS